MENSVQIVAKIVTLRKEDVSNPFVVQMCAQSCEQDSHSSLFSGSGNVEFETLSLRCQANDVLRFNVMNSTSDGSIHHHEITVQSINQEIVFYLTNSSNFKIKIQLTGVQSEDVDTEVTTEWAETFLLNSKDQSLETPLSNSQNNDAVGDIEKRFQGGQFERIDSALMTTHKHFFKNNAMHDTLNGESLVEAYEVYLDKTTGEICCVIRVGNRLNGHNGVVHGGITALAFDNTFGWLLYSLKTEPAFTANLNVNYRKKISENSTLVIRARVTETQNRKLFMSAIMEDAKQNVVAEATSLFIVAKKDVSSH